MSGWLMSIVGVIFVGVLMDILLGDKKSNKYVKSIYALVVVYIIITPVIGLLTSDFDLSKYLKDISISSNYVESINESKKVYYEEKIVSGIEQMGYKSPTVHIQIENGNNFSVVMVSVNIVEQFSKEQKSQISQYINSILGEVNINIY